MVWKNTVIEGLVSDLAVHDYPNPTKYSRSVLAEDFFYNVMNDDEIDINTRLDAAQARAIIDTMSRVQGIIGSARIDKVFSEAINKYHRIKFSGKPYYD